MLFIKRNLRSVSQKDLKWWGQKIKAFFLLHTVVLLPSLNFQHLQLFPRKLVCGERRGKRKIDKWSNPTCHINSHKKMGIFWEKKNCRNQKDTFWGEGRGVEREKRECNNLWFPRKKKSIFPSFFAAVHELRFFFLLSSFPSSFLSKTQQMGWVLNYPDYFFF